jgi:hypothetical protein
MNCKKSDILINCYIDGEITEREKSALLKHLDECSYCRKKYESLKTLSEKTMELNRIEGTLSERNKLIDDLHDRIKELPAVKREKPFIPLKHVAWIGAAAAALIILAVFALPLLKPVQQETSEINPPPDMAMIEEQLIQEMVEYLEDERTYASSYEVYAEPVLAVYEYIPAPSIEGYIDTNDRESTQHKGT